MKNEFNFNPMKLITKNKFKPNSWYRSNNFSNWLCYTDCDGNLVLFVNNSLLAASIGILSDKEIFYEVPSPKGISFNW